MRSLLSCVAALAACAWLAGACALAQEGGMADRPRVRVRAPELAGGRGWLNTGKPLAFPGKVLADERGGRLFVADSDHNRIVVAKLDGTLVSVIGTGERGAADGAFDRATFHRPQGLALDAGKNSDEDALYVADTENHLIRKVDLRARTVTTVAGTGRRSNTDPRDEASNAAPARTTALNSPWDLQLVGRRLYIAMAGPHQIWRMNLTTGIVSVFAGTGREARADGPRLAASFAQPSGLATDGSTLFVSDAGSNVIRAITLAAVPKPSADDGDEPRTESDSKGDALQSVLRGVMPQGGADDDTKAVPTPTPEDATPPQVATLAGGDHFDFGDADGEGDEVRLQHPLGVQYVEGYGVFVADTYNHKIKLLDPSERTVKTVAGTGKPGQADGEGATFYEPGGISYAAGKLYVADTNNHAIRVVDPTTGKTSTLVLRGLAPPASSPGTTADANAPSPLTEEFKPEPRRVAANSDAVLTISVELPAGYHLNESAPQRHRVTASPRHPSFFPRMTPPTRIG